VWNYIFSVLIAILCLGCLIGSISAVLTAKAERELLLRRLALCESQAKSAVNSVDELREITETVAQQQKMSRVRKASVHALRGSLGEPDPKADPEGWRAWKNSQLRTGVVN
jgi:hypothetical protein